jgi:hypothetical protein
MASGLIIIAGAASAQPPAGQGQASSAADAAAEPHSLPQDGLFSSIKQNFREGEQEVVRGYFELGEDPNVHRYYCLIDARSGRREPNGVLGDLVVGSDGMTRLKANSAVSMYSCAKAEQKGYLVTSGFVIPPRWAKAAAPAAAPAASTAAAAPASAPPATVTAAPPAAPAAPATAVPPPPVVPPVPPSVSANKIDVAGVSLGMSPEEVRSVLKSKKLRNFKEWTETLSAGDKPIPNGRFVNVIATWTPPSTVSAEDSFDTDGESFEVMFTPVPGAERAMAIVHSEGYSPPNAIHEHALDSGLLKKYGGYVTASELPQSVTWRFQSDGSVQVGDPCGRRGIFGGLGGLAVGNSPRENLALKRTAEEFRAQVERCGDATVTEDHFTPNGGALPADRLVTRFTVTAYSAVLARDGAKQAAQLIQAARGNPKSERVPAKDSKTPDL